MAQEFIARLQVSDNGFAFDPQTGSTFSLNHIGVKAIHLLRQGKSQDQIAREIAEGCDIEEANALRDIEDFVVSLEAFGRE